MFPCGFCDEVTILDHGNAGLFKKIILCIPGEIKGFGRSVSLLSNPDNRWKNRKILSYKSPCLTNNSIVICKIIVGTAKASP